VPDGSLPEPLASNAHVAAYFVGADLFELARVAALPGEGSFEYGEFDGGCSCGWEKRLFLLGTFVAAYGIDGVLVGLQRCLRFRHVLNHLDERALYEILEIHPLPPSLSRIVNEA